MVTGATSVLDWEEFQSRSCRTLNTPKVAIAMQIPTIIQRVNGNIGS